MDVMMPGVDGPTTFREMQQIPAIAHIPVLLLTAKVQGVDKRRFAGLGVAAVLFKPFDPLTLAEQIAEALQWNAGPPVQTSKAPSETTYIPK
jgi:CheY-like chemotaxis protein